MRETGAIKPHAARRAMASSDQTVLIVDDVPYLLELASLFLGRTARVVTAGGGEEGLDKAWREQPDLILCDDNMPGLNGAGLCRKVRQDPDLQATPFIMLLSDPSAAARGAAIRAGADDVLAKPLSRLSLVDSVSRLLTATRVQGLPRIDTNVPVTVTTGGTELTGIVRNLSRGGAFVETDSPLTQANEVDLRFQLPDSAATLSASAEVIWCRSRYESIHTPDGAGLRFVEIDGPSARSLDEFVYERTTPPSSNAGVRS